MLSRRLFPILMTCLLVLEGCGQTATPATPASDVRFATPPVAATPSPTSSPTLAPASTVTLTATSSPSETPTLTTTGTATSTSTGTASATSTSTVPATSTVGATNTPRPIVVNPTSTPPGTRTVTTADNGKTINLVVGQSFLLQLGDSLNWNVTIADQTVVSRVMGILVVRGAQGVYVARRAGQTTLTAVGDPPCRQSSPPCAAPSMMFAVTIVVR